MVKNFDFKNFVCIDDFSLFEKYSDALSGLESCEPVYVGLNAPADVKNYVDSKKAAAEMKNFVILTNDSSKYEGSLISNNIICVKNRPVEKAIADIKWVFSNFGADMKRAPETFVWSDPHFSHRNIVRYCSRPWNSGKGPDGEIAVTDEDVERMNEELIARFNSKVGKNDLTYCLGDFAFGDKSRIPEFVSRLNGRIRLLKGNHDRRPNQFYLDAGFEWVYDAPIIYESFFVMSHEPMQFLNANMPFVNLFGHVHDSDMYPRVSNSAVCCCVEKWDYYPVSMTEIKAMFEKREGE